MFGCIAYVHTKQGKLEVRAKRCDFIGYPPNIKGYKFWCLEPGEKKVYYKQRCGIWLTKYGISNSKT